MYLPDPLPTASMDDIWRSVGLSNRLKVLHDKMWDALVERGSHIRVYADDELIGEEDF